MLYRLGILLSVLCNVGAVLIFALWLYLVSDGYIKDNGGGAIVFGAVLAGITYAIGRGSRFLLSGY